MPRAARPHDFDESTPPPRGRPRGLPLARFLKLPPGEEVVPLFVEAEREGRIPAGCVLCKYAGKWPLGTGKKGGSGYVLLAVADSVGGRDPLRKRDGDELSDEHLEAFRVQVELVQPGVSHVIFAPLSRKES